MGSRGRGHAGPHSVDGSGWFGARWGPSATPNEGWVHGEGVV